MKKRTIVTLLVVLVLISQSLTLRVVADSQFQIAQTYWGSTTNPLEVGPGDKSVTLNVVVQNTGLQTYTGLSAILFLTFPFTNLTSGYLAQGFSSGTVSPGQPITLQFQLNVAEGAQVGSYSMAMNLQYGKTFGLGESLSVPVLLLGAVQMGASITPASLSASSINALTLTVSNEGSGTASKVSVVLNFPTGISVGGDNQLYFQTIQPKENKVIILDAYAQPSLASSSVQVGVSITYADAYGTSRTVSRTVGLKVLPITNSPLTLTVKDNQLQPGTLNTVALDITNNQTKSVSFVQALLTPPSGNALVVFGDNTWFFKTIDPYKNAAFSAQLMVPLGAADTNYQLTLTLSYLDPSNVSRTETHVFGVRVLPAPKNVFIVSMKGTVLTAGSFNKPQVTLFNSGKGAAHSVTVAITLPQAAGATTSAASIVFSAGNQWYFDSIQANGSVTFSPEIFAALGAIDTSYQIQLTVSYTDEHEVSRVETKSIGFSVQGLIYLQLQDVVVSPSRAAPGDNVTILGNLLNRGNAPGMYVTVDTKSRSPYLSNGTQYMGEVDTNTITPFSIVSQVDRRAQNGTYPIAITVNYSDNYNVTRRLAYSTSLVVASQTRSQVIPTPSAIILGMTPIGLLFFTGIAIIIIVTAVVFWRNRGTKRQKVRPTA